MVEGDERLACGEGDSAMGEDDEVVLIGDCQVGGITLNLL